MLLLLIVILLLANALFVMVEMALVSARKARLQARADRGDKGAKIALELLEKPTSFLSTTQIGITLISILMGAFGEAAIAERLQHRMNEMEMPTRWSHPIALVVTVLILTYASLVIAELVPKRIGQARAETIASWFAPVTRLVATLAAPLIWILTISTELILKLIPLKAQNEHASTEEEVKALIATGTEAGVFHQEEQELVERVFKLSDQRVTALMVPRTDIDFLRADDSIERVRVVLATSSHSHYPVVKSGAGVGGLDDLLGVVHVKDLVRAGIVSDSIDLGVISKKPEFIPESMPAIKVLEQFRDSGNHIAFVINEYGSIMGLVTFNDLLEAIVGQVSPAASGDSDPAVVRRPDGSYLLDGMLPVSDLKELMGVATLPREGEAGFETLGGFVMSYLGHIPATGDRFELDAGAAPVPDEEDTDPEKTAASSSSSSSDDSPPASDRRVNQPAPLPPRFLFEVLDMDRTRVDKVLLTMQGGVGEAPGGEGI